MIMKAIKTRFVTIVAALVLFSAPSFAAADTGKESEDSWQFNLAPFYLWAINLEGDLTTGANRLPLPVPVTVPVSVPFEDVFDGLESVFIVHFEGMHRSNWGFLVDVNYLDLGADFTSPQGFGLRVDMELTLVEAAGVYRIPKGAHDFHALFGLRHYGLDPDVSLQRGTTLADKSQDWTDPFIGGRWIWNFAEGWSLIARGDIGGFGAGSDFAWQALGLVEWQPFNHVSFLAGYRALDIDYEDGSGRDYFRLDATIHGPLLGVNFKW